MWSLLFLCFTTGHGFEDSWASGRTSEHNSVSNSSDEDIDMEGILTRQFLIAKSFTATGSQNAKIRLQMDMWGDIFCNGNGHYSSKLAKCSCYQCFKGRRCSALRSCFNGGVKSSSLESCVCPAYVSGRCCEKPDCAGRGTRSRMEDSCKCPYPKFQSGRYCEIIRCANGGLGRRGRCTCRYGFTGLFCENWICKNGGTALPNNTCSCAPFTSGDHCEIWECRNWGTRMAYDNQCDCSAFFTGPHCENIQYYPDLFIIAATLAAIVAIVCFTCRVWKGKRETTMTSLTSRTSPIRGQRLLHPTCQSQRNLPGALVENHADRHDMPSTSTTAGEPPILTLDYPVDEPPPYPNDLPSYSSLFGDISGRKSPIPEPS